MAAKPAERLQSVQQFRDAIEPFALAMRPPAVSRASVVSLSPSGNSRGTVPMSSVSSRPIPQTRVPSSASLSPMAAPAQAPGEEPPRPPPYGDPASPYSAHDGYPAAPGPSLARVSVFPYGDAPLVTAPPRAATKGPSGGLIAAIVVLVIAAVSGGILWSIYYFTDVFDDPAPAVKKPKVVKPAPTTKAPHPGK
jgi:hypothetical protein